MNLNYDKERSKRMRKNVPIWEKATLTLEEAAEYSGIGINNLWEISNDEHCGFMLWNGSKRLIKRRKLEEYLEGCVFDLNIKLGKGIRGRGCLSAALDGSKLRGT